MDFYLRRTSSQPPWCALSAGFSPPCLEQQISNLPGDFFVCEANINVDFYFVKGTLMINLSDNQRDVTRDSIINLLDSEDASLFK